MNHDLKHLNIRKVSARIQQANQLMYEHKQIKRFYKDYENCENLYSQPAAKEDTR